MGCLQGMPCRSWSIIITAGIYDDAHRIAHLVIDAFLAVGIILVDVARDEEVCPYTVDTCLYLCLALAKECRVFPRQWHLSETVILSYLSETR